MRTAFIVLMVAWNLACLVSCTVQISGPRPVSDAIDIGVYTDFTHYGEQL